MTRRRAVQPWQGLAAAVAIAALLPALAGCESVGITTAASMRIEVEVYKGPLSKTVDTQWGEFTGLMNEISESLTLYGDSLLLAAANLGYVTGENHGRNLGVVPHFRANNPSLSPVDSVPSANNIGVSETSCPPNGRIDVDESSANAHPAWITHSKHVV